jgi:maleate cis-trans isomerase
VEKAIKEMRDKKATGDDDVPVEALKLLGDDGLSLLTQLISNIHESQEWPKDFMIDKLIEVGRGYGMEINVEKTKKMRISRQPTPLQIKIKKQWRL